ncbi:MAG: GNAT family N-acetyltransferase [Leptolyngbyaceae cyanobacterium bins.59]|nr:GNAT family N-acetyltransferase [Leptolyngbyaceae cyanobacterium bins.59]
MTSAPPDKLNISIRPVQLNDLDRVEQLFLQMVEVESPEVASDISRQFQQIRRWYGPLMLLNLFPNPLQHLFSIYVAEQDSQIIGAIQVSPFNRTRSTWQVDRVVVDSPGEHLVLGSQLLRYCLETIWEARTWLVEVDVNNKSTLALYRHNGFQLLAQTTYWSIAPELLPDVAEREPDLPNLLPISNADAQLLYQLDTASMPPLVRQVFDRHLHDFKTHPLDVLVETIGQRLGQVEVVSGYVFEPQRKAAIGYFRVNLSRDGSRPHTSELTVHPAYTWLYPELLNQMARVAQVVPGLPLHLVSADYQAEREAYLERLGATRISHTSLMSRSVWHKLREVRPSLEGLQLSEVLQGFQRAQKPIPGRVSMQWANPASEQPNSSHSRRKHPKLSKISRMQSGDHGYHFSSGIRHR